MIAVTESPADRYGIDTSGAVGWFSAESLKPVHALNELLLTLLAEEALRPSGSNRLLLAVQLREVMASLDTDARRRAACCPIALVDAGFHDEKRWTAATSGKAGSRSDASTEGNFPHLAAIQLAQMTLTLASTAAQVDLKRACLMFGMSPACAQLLAPLSLPTLQRLAERHSGWVRPRWEHRPHVWRTMLELAGQRSPNGLPSIGLRAMQLQLGELALATPICAATRQIFR